MKPHNLTVLNGPLLIRNMEVRHSLLYYELLKIGNAYFDRMNKQKTGYGAEDQCSSENVFMFRQ